MTPTAAAPSPLARRRPFGVIVICLLLLFQAGILAIGTWAFVQAGASGSQDVILELRGLGLNATFLTTASAVNAGTALLAALLAMTLLQVVLVFTLRRSGWVLTMLVVGVNLAIQLWGIWQGGPTATLSLLILSLTALYLNQAEVRAAFGIGAGRIESVIARGADAVREAS